MKIHPLVKVFIYPTLITALFIIVSGTTYLMLKIVSILFRTSIQDMSPFVIGVFVVYGVILCAATSIHSCEYVDKNL